jgi:uncharacterized membrane protein YdjX (TVP38/TMEM64 family)
MSDPAGPSSSAPPVVPAALEADSREDSRILATWRKYRAHVVALFFSAAVTAAVLLFRQQLASLGTYGYFGVFIIAVLGNATVIIPVPSLAVTFAAGAVLNPLAVGLVAGLGEPLGELTGYLAGYGGSAVIEDAKRFMQIKTWMERHGFLTIFVLAAIPNPLFDLAGISAGMLHFPVTRFLLACWLGKTLKAIAVAYIGSSFPALLGPLLH